ncbi:MAG: DUF3108 domain-containing protein [Desulfovibrionaceae bacterium]|nr:DUF3108 domain-containing protein [Desulfovibrionaceae bacterium]
MLLLAWGGAARAQVVAQAALAAPAPVQAPGDAAAQAAPGVPFGPGEKLHFVLKWASIPAGYARLEVGEPVEVRGERAQHLVMTARTNSFVDIFFKVRDRVDSFVDEAVGRSLLFKKRQREGGYERDIVVDFDWDALKARYTNRGEPKEPVTILPGTFDVLSVFYRFRFMDLEEGARLLAPVTDGRKFVLGEAYVVRRERVRVPAGDFDAYLVRPDLKHLGGVFKKSKDASLDVWVTADARRIPLLVRSKVAVGHFTVELTGIERPGEGFVGDPDYPTAAQ